MQGIGLALGLTLPLTALVIAAGGQLSALGVQPTVARLAKPYVEAIAWSLGPLLLFTAFRRYLQATDRLGPILFALISANVVNALTNWILVFGHLGAPVLGVRGSGWATTASRIYMVTVIAASALASDWRRRLWFVPQLEVARIRRLLALGFPAAMQATLEVGVFALATTLAGQFAPTDLAAHQIILNVASLTFMIPLGLASAAAIRVGHALGRGDPEGAARAGSTAIALGAALMLVCGLTFLLVPRTILIAFTNDPAVIPTGLVLFMVAAGFQLFDGLQGVATGALRGAGDTRTPMLVNLLAHWALGLPVGYFLAFHGGLAVLGLWVGLSLGLVTTAVILVRVWVMQARTLKRLPTSDFE
jgi:MATE family multidrug resistance protein